MSDYKLQVLREHLSKNQPVTLLDDQGKETQDIIAAKKLSLNNQEFSLDQPTDFIIDNASIPLRVILHCWLHRDSSAADYLADCQEKQLTNISFLQRTDLINWLSGSSETSQYISTGKQEGEETGSSTADAAVSTTKDLLLEQTLDHERVLLDHNSSLRGFKPTNFGYLIKEAELKLVHSLKNSRRSKQPGGSGVSKSNVNKKAPRKDPIILIPSAASSIFTIANIRQFLEESKYIHPRDLPAAQSDLTTTVKKFDRFSKPIKFLIVNNTRLFTKPEYWDRVVAVFTTGHTWQFNNYQWSNPAELFQRCKGYYFHFSGDIVPKHVDQWNVQKVELDKNKRFKDIEVLRYFWNTMEKELVARGYH